MGRGFLSRPRQSWCGAQPRATAFSACRSGYQQDSGTAWHGWFLAMLCLEGAGFWLSMAWAEPGHASFGGCWILAQHGMGGAWPCFAWSVLESRSERLEGAQTSSRASYLSVRRPRPCWELAVFHGPESGSGG